MLIPSGSQNIYKTVLVWHGSPNHISICTGHFAAVIPGVLDDTTEAAQAMNANYGPLILAECPMPLNDLQGGAELVECTSGFSAPFGGIIGSSFLANDGTPLEACLRIQRVGAVGGHSIKGRIRIGPLTNRMFTDQPRYRRINVSRGSLVTTLSNLNTAQPSLFFGMQEVLYNRWTGDAVTVDSWTCPVYTSRVWQRAGYPQGVRGPDRH